MPPAVRALRGATCVAEDTVEEVTERVQEMLRQLLSRNGLSGADLISLFFTATDDLVSMFPAAAARDMGLVDVPLMCARELGVTGALPRCVRVLAHVSTDAPTVHHVYLHEARSLRDDR